MILKGKVWKFGDDLHTDYFLSRKHDPLVRAGKYSELAQHVLEDVDPGFVRRVQRGDLLVAGENFGTGKHLSGLVGAFKTLSGGLIGAFKELGIGGIIAGSFSAEWEKGAVNSGLPAVVYGEILSNVETGDLLELDLGSTEARNLTRNITIRVHPTPRGIIDILEAGGLEYYTMRRLSKPVSR